MSTETVKNPIEFSPFSETILVLLVKRPQTGYNSLDKERVPVPRTSCCLIPLSFRASPQAGVGIRVPRPRARRRGILHPCHSEPVLTLAWESASPSPRPQARNPPPLSFRASPQAGVGIRVPVPAPAGAEPSAPVIANQSADWCGNPQPRPRAIGAEPSTPVIANQSADWCGNPQPRARRRGSTPTLKIGVFPCSNTVSSFSSSPWCP